MDSSGLLAKVLGNLFPPKFWARSVAGQREGQVTRIRRAEWPGGSMSTSISLLRMAKETISVSQQARRKDSTGFLIDVVMGVVRFLGRKLVRLWSYLEIIGATHVPRAVFGARNPAGASR